jgi:hypothetical protein
MKTLFKLGKARNETECRRKERLRPINRRMIRLEKAERGCELCGAHDLPPQKLHFHHPRGVVKRRKIAHLISAATAGLVEEMRRCQLWCDWSHFHFHKTGEIRLCPRALAEASAKTEVRNGS